MVLVITVSAAVAGYQAIDRLTNPRPLEAVGVLFATGIIGFIGNEWVAVYGSGPAGASGRPPWWPTVCTPGWTGSPRWR